MNKKIKQIQSLPVLNASSAGIDIGASFHVVAIPPDMSDEPVRTFEAFTTDLSDMANWLVKKGITTAAMDQQAYIGFLFMKFYKIMVST